MSDKERGWVWDHSPYSGTAKLIHLKMADWANEGHEWQLWCGDATLTQKANCNRRTVERLKAQMVIDGMLEDLQQRHENGNRLYRLLMPGSDQDDALAALSKCANATFRPTNATFRPSRTSSSVKPEEPQARDDEKTKGRGRDYRFVDVWATWPTRRGVKLNKAKALEQWKKLAYPEKVAAWQGLQRFVASHPEFPPDLFRWLRDKGWLDWATGENVPSEDSWRRSEMALPWTDE